MGGCRSCAIQKDGGSKGMAAKQALAWWISERTTVSRLEKAGEDQN